MKIIKAEEFFNKNIKDLDGNETKNSLIFFYKASIISAMEAYAQQFINAAENIIGPACEILPETYNEELKAWYDLTNKSTDTQKVVISCEGSFRISQEQCTYLSGKGIYEATDLLIYNEEEISKYPDSNWSGYIMPDNEEEFRINPLLIEAVTLHPSDNLKIIEIPAGIKWHLEETESGEEYIAEDYITWK